MSFLRSLFDKLPSKNHHSRGNRFGTFGGVFTPSCLTILGVIMYLRLGWVVGNAGFLGAVAIILLAKTVTICTGLSMSSITTNIRIGAGGAYSIISKSMGLEAGGSVGIPFYISQTLAAALYIVGFTEGWIRIFPSHTPVLVSLCAWLLLLLISYLSAQFAIRIQYVIMIIIGLSVLAFVFTKAQPNETFTHVGNFEDGNFWQLFAIFFPAVTGIMAGVNLSGELKNPRKAIPVGTISAIGVTLVIYVSMAYVCAKFIPNDQLRMNQMVMVDYAFWSPIVLCGILAATFSSALGSMVGAPRILQALAEQKTVPFNKFFAAKAANKEPRNAIVFTSLIIVIAIAFGNLNALATLITMFFLITYGTLNLVVFIQQSMKIISFRPTFKIPRFVSFIGGIGCIFIMFLINPIFSIVAFMVIIALYAWLTKWGLQSDWGDIRGGMFLVLAERASRMSAKFPRHQISWKPDLLVPIDDPKVWAGSLLLIKSITYPSGSVYAFTVREDNIKETEDGLIELLAPLQEENILTSSTVIEEKDFLHGTKLVIQALRGGALRPNTLFLTLGADDRNDATVEELTLHALNRRMGTIIMMKNQSTALGMQKDVNLWLRDKSPNWNLAVLIALHLQMNWEGKLNLITSTPHQKEEKQLYRFLHILSDQARLPSMTDLHVLIGEFDDALQRAPRADVNILGFPRKISFDLMRNAAEKTKSTCLFVGDSGQEDALV